MTPSPSGVPARYVSRIGPSGPGHDEIRSWLTVPASEFTTTSVRLSAETDADTTAVLVRLTGDFPGGQVDLRHVFVLDATGLIETLTIAV